MSSHHSALPSVVIEIRNGDSNSDSDAVIIIHHADRAASAGELPRRQTCDRIENRIKKKGRKERRGRLGPRVVGRLTSSAPGCCDWGWQENAGGFGRRRRQQPLRFGSSPRFWTAITQSMFRLKENSWLADEMTCFCLCHRRVAAADAAV